MYYKMEIRTEKEKYLCAVEVHGVMLLITYACGLVPSISSIHQASRCQRFRSHSCFVQACYDFPPTLELHLETRMKISTNNGSSLIRGASCFMVSNCMQVTG